ncbi:MAG: hypothetical protein AMXMBFR64_26970 [Myxococcales bacterium]
MGERAQTLREQLQRVGAAKDATRVRDDSAWLSLSLEERLLGAVRHSDSLLRLCAPQADSPDAEHEVWEHVRRHLEAHRD